MLNVSNYSISQNFGPAQILVTEKIMPNGTCSKKTTRRPQNLYALCDLKQGDAGKVAFIRAESPMLETIFSMGFTFGGKVAVETLSEDVLEVNFGEFNILMGRDVAAKIFVELT
jgi:Fe2+ transport system protein FeoA